MTEQIPSGNHIDVSYNYTRFSSTKKIITATVFSILLHFGIEHKANQDKHNAQKIRKSGLVTTKEVQETCLKIGDWDVFPIRQQHENACAQATIISLVRSITGKQLDESIVAQYLDKTPGSNSYTPQIGLIASTINHYFSQSGSLYYAKATWGIGDTDLIRLLIHHKALVIIPYYSPSGDIHYGQAIWNGKQVTIVSSGGLAKSSNGDIVNFHFYQDKNSFASVGNLPTLQMMPLQIFLDLKNSALVEYSSFLHSISNLFVDLPVIVVKKKTK